MSLVTLIVGGSRAARDAAVERATNNAGAQICEVRAANWPFLRRLEQLAAPKPSANAGAGPAAGRLVLVTRDLHVAFPNAQTGGTRLVLTQSAYQLQRWLDWLDARGNATLVADADRHALRKHASEVLARRGPWSRTEIVELQSEPADDERAVRNGRADEPYAAVWDALTSDDPADRLARCRRAVEARPDDEVVQLTLGSALMEVRDLDASEEAIRRAIACSPDWEAAHYELGKLYLRRDDLDRASRAFGDAARLMRTFSAAFSNLGATLGELDRRDEALDAFHHALRYDPNGYTILNNIGVVSRELGRLSDSEAAFRKVVALAPEFVFGHYNLGHTLFLQGRYRAALSAYVEGQRRDPERNARQACRLAVVRLAAGDPDGSLHDLRRCLDGLPADQKREILAEAQEILWALLTDQPVLAGWKRVADAVKSELDGL